MSSLLSSSEITYLTGQFANLFDTLSQFNTITVNKQPTQTLSQTVTNNDFYGYNNNVANTTYTPISQTFAAVIMYDKPAKPAETFQEVKLTLGKGKCRVKVDQNCKNYIENGVTLNIIANNETYNVISDDGIQNYLGLKYYYYLLEKTN